MRVQAILSVTCFALGALGQKFTIPNVNVTFSEDILPFQINVDPNFIEDTRRRVANARLPINTGVFPLSDGPIIQNATAVQGAWVNDYDWGSVQASINANLKQYTTLVQAEGSNYTEPVPLHFVHHKSPRPDAIPLIFLHGWPGNFLEVSNIINLLTNPPNSSLPAFHVVAPSLPGFGFSPAPIAPGCGPIASAHAFNALMRKLNYPRYVAQGGDWGGVTLRLQAFYFPDSLISLLDNLFVIQPNATDLARFAANTTTPDETSYINALVNTFEDQRSGYRLLQQTAPLSLAYATTDSPLGLAMWLYQSIRGSIDYTVPTTPSRFDATEIVTWTLMHYIQGPYAGFRFYKEGLADGAWSGLAGYAFGDLPYVTQPVAIAEFPHDIWYGLPLDWAQRRGNVKVRYQHDQGGHFAAFEVPQILAQDVWTWFGDRELSGTGVFYK